MAKRTRYPGRTSGRRPGTNRLVRRDAPRAKPLIGEPTSTPEVLEPVIDSDPETGAPVSARGSGLSQAEIDRAAELEAEMTTRERALQAAVRARANQGVSTERHLADVNAPLAVRASKEYAYVARDVRRIIVTALLMVAILAVIDVLVNVTGVVKV